MVYILKSKCCSTLVAYITTIAFTTVTLIPPPLMAANINLDLTTINFGIKIEKLFEKVKRSIDKGETNKIVGYMFDFKHEVEQYTGKKIGLCSLIGSAYATKLLFSTAHRSSQPLCRISKS